MNSMNKHRKLFPEFLSRSLQLMQCNAMQVSGHRHMSWV